MRTKMIHEVGGQRTFVAVFETGEEAFSLLSEFVKRERVAARCASRSRSFPSSEMPRSMETSRKYMPI